MTDYVHAAFVIAYFEGFVPVAKWDVNAWRLGYGSDTEGPQQSKVSRGMSTTPERAKQNLAARLPEFETTILAQIGPDRWAAFTRPAQSALLSYAYNYGELTPTLCQLIERGSPLEDIAAAVEARAIDNAGVNRNRRCAEAGMILAS